MTTGSLGLARDRPPARRLDWQELLALATAVIVIVAQFAPVPTMARFVVDVAFAACAPGVALLTLAGGRRFGPSHPGLVAALGFALVILYAEILLWVHAFHARIALTALAGVVAK